MLLQVTHPVVQALETFAHHCLVGGPCLDLEPGGALVRRSDPRACPQRPDEHAEQQPDEQDDEQGEDGA